MKIKDLSIVKYRYYGSNDIVETDDGFETSKRCESYNWFSERLLELAELNHEYETDEWGNEVWYDKKEKILEYMNSEIEEEGFIEWLANWSTNKKVLELNEQIEKLKEELLEQEF